MKLSKELCELLREVNLDENDDFPYLNNFFSEQRRYPDGCTTFFDFLTFLNDLLKLYFKRRRLESFEEFLNNMYPPKEILEDSGTED